MKGLNGENASLCYTLVWERTLGSGIIREGYGKPSHSCVVHCALARKVERVLDDNEVCTLNPQGKNEVKMRVEQKVFLLG